MVVKYIIRQYHLELIPQSSLYNSVVSSVVFVIGFFAVDDACKRSYDACKDIRALGYYFAEMERGKVPPNFVVKLKQQQTVLLRSRHRVNYIQRIKFIPSATILARSIVAALITLLMITDIDPFYAGLAIVGAITFTLVYMLILIKIISKPFHKAGKTRDDVSLFLINDAADYLGKRKKDV